MKLRSIALISIAAMISCGAGSSSRETTLEDSNHPGMSAGKAIFVANCNQCHKLNEKTIGPALVGTMQRWNNDTPRVTHFIKNSAEAISLGDPRAKQVYDENNQSPMPPMTHLTDNDVIELIDYINKGVE